MSRHDVIVVGLGAMGSAAAWRLAQRGARVVAFDRFEPPHTLGSTHGRTRIIREAYFEHPAYVPFIRRAYELWEDTERAANERLFLRTRGLMIGPADGEIVSGSLRSAIEHGVAHEMLSAPEVRRRFPLLHPAAGMVALLEQRAGILFPEQIVRSQLRLASGAGAELRTGERVISWTADAAGVRVSTAAGRSWEADRLVLAAGPWMPELLGSRGVPLAGERQAMHWFTPRDGATFDVRDYPIALWDDPGGPAFATFPDLGDGFKIAIHHDGPAADPETMDRTPQLSDERAARHRLARYVPAANGELRDAALCIYTNTPDEHFVIDYLDDSRRVIVASPCSGHGFKFASAVGDAVACLAVDAPPPVDLSLFSIARFGSRASDARG